MDIIMPGALDVLVEIQFSADDTVLKEINSQLEKESNILKTIEDRLKQLNIEVGIWLPADGYCCE